MWLVKYVVYLEYNNKTKNTNKMKKFRHLKTEDQFQFLTFLTVMGFLVVTVVSWAVNGFITTL